MAAKRRKNGVAESEGVTEATERGHRGSRRLRADDGEGIGRKEAQKAQKSESEGVTEVTERGHRGGRRRTE